ncbi:MAG: trypsin-like peptidase domain-containing protein [Candidatus Bathyarchaeia archaeon]
MGIYQKHKAAYSSFIILIIIIASLFGGGLFGYLIDHWAMSEKLDSLENQLSTLQEQMSNLQQTQNIINQNNTYILGENVSLSELYEQVKESVVIIRGVMVQYDIFHRPYYTQVQGSGFVYNFTGEMVIITNYHVIESTINITVTFINGDGYAATVLGSDPYADLAVLSTDAPTSEFKPLEIASSSTLKVGDVVVAVGNPYGLSGSMSIGIVSALGRTITEETGGYPIANVIQTTAPLNPGNSGGPLLNLQGQVVGITTAIISDSQGLGFAIPSNTILREIASLVTTGSYNNHPWLGASGIDMTYEIAKAISANITYGWLITQVVSGGPAANAGLKGGTKQVLIAGEYVTVGGDIIIAINGTRITSVDTLSTYLEENTSPGQTIEVTIMRENQTMNVAVTLGTRP